MCSADRMKNKKMSSPSPTRDTIFPFITFFSIKLSITRISLQTSPLNFFCCFVSLPIIVFSTIVNRLAKCYRSHFVAAGQIPFGFGYKKCNFSCGTYVHVHCSVHRVLKLFKEENNFFWKFFVFLFRLSAFYFLTFLLFGFSYIYMILFVNSTVGSHYEQKLCLV